MQVTGVILAGGQSRRMGRDKAFLPFGQGLLIERVIEVIQQDYMRAAAAKGLRRKTVLYGHGFRNVLIPLVTLLGLSIPEVFAGSLIVENVFAYPGMGRLAITAINDKDHTLVMGITLMFAVLVIIGNLIADQA